MRIAHPAAGFRHSKLDANENLFLPLQLEKLSARVNMIRYPDLTWMAAFPIVDDPPAPGQTSYAYADQDQSGDPDKVGLGYSDKGPRVGISRKKNTSPVQPLTAHYGFNLGEIQSAMRAGLPLSMEGARACRYVIESAMDKIAWLGNAGANLPGFLTTPSINSALVADNGAGSTLWADKTAAQIIADLRTALQTIIAATKGIGGLLPNRLAMPSKQYADLVMRPRDSGTDETVLTFALRVLRQYEPDFQIVRTERLVASGAGALDEFCLFRASPDVLGQVLVKPYTELPPQEEAFDTVIYAAGEFGGVVVRQPKACGRFRGI